MAYDEPFERLQPINIRYRPNTGNEVNSKNLPFKLLVLGDFSAGCNPTRSLSDRNAVRVVPTNFDQVLASHQIRLELSVPDRLSGDPDARIPVTLPIRSMEDFGPDRIAKEVEPLARRLELRAVLVRMRKQFVNNEEFRKQLVALASDSTRAKQFLAVLKGEAAPDGREGGDHAE